jgi:WD40 repeat protein
MNSKLSAVTSIVVVAISLVIHGNIAANSNSKVQCVFDDTEQAHVYDLAWSDGFLAIATSLGAVIYDLETEQFELLGKEGQATTSVAFSSDGELIAVGQRDTSTTQIFSVDNFDL